MARSLSAALLGAALLISAPTTAAAAPPAGGPEPGPPASVDTVYIPVEVGDDDERCVIVADVYRPARADAQTPVPAVLTTHGFGGSKDSQAGLARALAGRGYAVLAYSGLGFGGSTCPVSLDSPERDGRAAAGLVDVLAGAPNLYADPATTEPLPALDYVRTDAPGDPRVGMIGGSYGGQVQFAAAAVDPRIDALVPMVTWHDLGHSLAPNSIATTADGITAAVPGTAKTTWLTGFFTLGALAPGVEGYLADPPRAQDCPNFEAEACAAMIGMVTDGLPDAAAEQVIDRSSVARYLDRVDVPTLLIQGQADTLFTLDEATATFHGLRERGVETAMIWQRGGHSGDPAPGEMDDEHPDPQSQYVTARIYQWLDHHLRGGPAPTEAPFTYFQDWVDYTGSAAPAYGSAQDVPVDPVARLALSETGLVPGTDSPAPFTRAVATVPAGLPMDGETVAWRGEPLTDPVTVVGAPQVRLDVSADPVPSGGPAGAPVFFVRLVDIAPDGTSSPIEDLVAPVRAPDVSAPIEVALPSIVHRFAPGHRIGLEVLGGHPEFRGAITEQTVRVHGGELVLPGF